MRDVKNRGWVLPLVDLVLLALLLKVGFMLNPQPRPEFAMIGAAVVIQLFIGPRSGRSLNRALASSAVILLAFAFFWRRPVDSWPLLVWLLPPVWALATGRLATSAGVWHRVAQWLRPAVARLGEAWRRAEPRPAMRHLPIVVLVVAALLLMWPYLFSGIVGAGDAKWYAKTVADYVVQMRAGFFPIWTAQSDWSFYGGIFPLRLAPYLAHLAGVVDLLTFRQLPPGAVMNMCLVASLAAGMVSMFLCLRTIIPERRWTATGLALAYGLCPGVIGLAYAQDLYMSFCTLPFLPVAFLGAVRSFTRDDLGPRLLLSGGLAATWLAHPPIGMWAGAVLAVTQAVRWLTRKGGRPTWRADGVAAGLFILLAGFSFVSVRSLGPIADANPPFSLHVRSIRESFPANWLPIHPSVRALDNLQLGYGLAALAVFLATQVWRSAERRVAGLLLACAAGLIVLLLPIPLLTENIWRAMPQVVLNITNIWPAQRLLVLAAIAVVMAAALWLAGGPLTRRQTDWFHWLLLAGLVWGGLETTKFMRRGAAVSGGWKQAVLEMRPENRTMAASALGPLRVQPRTFNHGVTDVQLEHRFLSLDKKQIIRNATDAIVSGAGPGEGQARPRPAGLFTGMLDPELPLFKLEPKLTLLPGKHYLLVFEFLDRNYTGILKMEGRDFFRVYRLPDAGNGLSFGSTPASARWLAMWQTTAQPEEISLLWIPATPGDWPEPVTPFARFDLREYDPAALDVVVESLVPYRVSVDTPAPCYLETPRIHYPDYRATVDGRPVAAEISPDGFVAVRLEPGRHRVELSYAAPLATRLAYWGSVIGWLGFLAFTVRWFRQAPRTAAS